MVENQHSINTVLSFGAKSVDPRILEKLLVGRKHTADYLDDCVENIVEDGNNHHILIIGQRGMGKTHLLRILYYRSTKYILDKRLVIAYFSEEEYGVSSYFDFLIRILYAFIRWNEKDRDLLQGKINELQEVPNSAQTNFAEKIISDYIQDRPLLILAENFGEILNAIGTNEQGKLRSWLYNNQRVSIISTSQSISDDFDSEDRPFYGFFNLYYLKTLTYKDSFNFLKSLAVIDNHEEVVNHLEARGKSQVRAIHDLVKGNHRLLVTFYEFLKSDTLAKLSNHFIKTINDLKPYYETYIRYLPPLQQKILRYIALSRTPQQGVNIAKNCFIDQNTLSKQLSELVRKKLIEAIPDPNDKRNRLYDIEEPLLRISIEVGEHKEGITALFVDFLAIYYDEGELKNKISKFEDLLNACQTTHEKNELLYEIAAIQRALEIKKPFTSEPIVEDEKSAEIFEALDNELYEEAIILILDLLKTNINAERVNIFKIILANSYLITNQFSLALDVLNTFSVESIKKNRIAAKIGYTMIKVSEIQSLESIYPAIHSTLTLAVENGENTDYVLSDWGVVLVKLGMKNNTEELVQEGIEKMHLAHEKSPYDIQALINLGYSKISISIKTDDQIIFSEGLSFFEKASKIKPYSNTLFKIWGGAISLAHGLFKISRKEILAFNNSFRLLKTSDRIAVWQILSTVYSTSMFKISARIILSDIKNYPNKMSSILVDWVVNLLGNANKSLDVENINDIKKIIIEAKKYVGEMEILEIYVNTYESYFLKENKSIIFELPKEQRIFFTDKILGQHFESTI